MAAIAASPTKPRVSSVSGSVTTTSSLRPIRVTSSEGGSVSSAQESGPESAGRLRSASTRIPSRRARSAIAWPMSP